MKKVLNSELNRLTIPEFKKAVKIPVIVILDNIRSLNNIGSVFRTSDAFLIEQVALCGITATPPNRDIHKTALGATESVDWKYFNTTNEAVEKFRNDGYEIICIEQVEKGILLNQFEINPDRKYAIIFGNEVNGVSQEVVDLADYSVEIEQFGTKHSLNISVCAGIVIWEFFKKLKK